MFDGVNILPLAGNSVFWEISRRDDKLKTRFTQEQWNSMFGNDFSENELFEFLENHPYYIRSYTLHHVNGQSIAFLYLLVDLNAKNVVSVHGGGWGKTLVSPLLYYYGIILMLERLLKKGIKVRTTMSVTNTRALRFMRSLGFVAYRYSETKMYLWINEKRLKSSKIYSYIKGRNMY